MAKYQSKPVPTVALQLIDIGVTYEKWGGVQEAKPGDWVMNKGGETFTCDGKVFANTYRPLTDENGEVIPHTYFKHAVIEAEQATGDGVIKTLEGESAYVAGDYIVTNPDSDQYPIERSKFEGLYEPA